MVDDVDVRIMHDRRCTAVKETPGGGSVRQSVERQLYDSLQHRLSMNRLFLPTLTARARRHTTAREPKHISVQILPILLAPFQQPPRFSPSSSTVVVWDFCAEIRDAAYEVIHVDFSPQGIGLDELVEGVTCGFE
jgi:hypothetical protein